MAVMMMMMMTNWGQALAGDCIVKYCASSRYDTDAAPSMGQNWQAVGLRVGCPKMIIVGVLVCCDAGTGILLHTWTNTAGGTLPTL